MNCNTCVHRHKVSYRPSESVACVPLRISTPKHRPQLSVAFASGIDLMTESSFSMLRKISEFVNLWYIWFHGNMIIRSSGFFGNGVLCHKRKYSSMQQSWLIAIFHLERTTVAVFWSTPYLTWGMEEASFAQPTFRPNCVATYLRIWKINHMPSSSQEAEVGRLFSDAGQTRELDISSETGLEDSVLVQLYESLSGDTSGLKSAELGVMLNALLQRGEENKPFKMINHLK